MTSLSVSTTTSLAEELSRLADLKRQDALTEEEFSDAKKKVIQCHGGYGAGGGGAVAKSVGGKACRVFGCNKCKPGKTHYCGNCGNQNSDHFKYNCPMPKKS